MIKAYMKVLRTIQSAKYEHLKNGTVVNLINNFANMYRKNKVEHKELLSLYEERINMYEQNN